MLAAVWFRQHTIRSFCYNLRPCPGHAGYFQARFFSRFQVRAAPVELIQFWFQIGRRHTPYVLRQSRIEQPKRCLNKCERWQTDLNPHWAAMAFTGRRVAFSKRLTSLILYASISARTV